MYVNAVNFKRIIVIVLPNVNTAEKLQSFNK